jgi:hypothetical protein
VSPATRGELHQAPGRGRVEGDGLLEDEVLARLEGGRRELDVRPVRRADMDDVDRGVGQQRPDVRRRVRHAERGSPRAGSLAIRASDRDDVGVPAAADRVDVERPDEAGPDDGGPKEAHGIMAAAARS